MNDIEKTIEYYNINAKNFAAGTVSVEFENMQNGFIGNKDYNKWYGFKELYGMLRASN